jgi:hypothetical protein
VTYFDSIFYEDILKYQLWEALKEIKIWTFNDEGDEKVVLQNEEVLAQSKAMDGHASQNVFKRWKNVINDTFTQLVSYRPQLVSYRPQNFSHVHEYVDDITSIP